MTRLGDRFEAAGAVLLAESGCTVRKWRTSMTGVAATRGDDWAIEAPRPRGPVSFGVFAHEVAHQLLHRHGSRPRWLQEIEASEWALAQFERFGLPGVERSRHDLALSLRYAARKAERRAKPETIAALKERYEWVWREAPWEMDEERAALDVAAPAREGEVREPSGFNNDPRRSRMSESPTTTEPEAKANGNGNGKTNGDAKLAEPKAVLAEYLAAEASADKVGTVEYPNPYVTADGRVYVHSRHMLRWARRAHGRKVEKRDVQAVLRDLGLKVRATPLPGLGKSVGFYTGKPKGVKLTGVPVRDRRRKSK